ncbi:MAG: DUF2442 domain-containing protein [Elusimicrobiota bacterium]|nr:DUF2442 domain-containing protein [Elusimicrobiota bacterium]
MTPQITKIEVMPGYKLCVRFGNGESRLFNIKPYLEKGVFKELKNEAYLKKVRIISGGIDWPHEQDLSADTLYYRGVPFKKIPRATGYCNISNTK